jgi:hypothetical protein
MDGASCSRCGRAVTGGDVLYSLEGDVLCPACNGNYEIERADQRAAENIAKAGYSALGLALATLVINPYLLITILAVSSGVYAIKSFAVGNERFSSLVANRRSRILFCAYSGIVLAVAIAALR